MGLTKRLLEQIEQGYLPDYEDKYVCDDCFSDQALKNYITSNATANDCSFCGRSAGEPIAASFFEALDRIRGGMATIFDRAVDNLPYETREGGYQGSSLPDMLVNK